MWVAASTLYLLAWGQNWSFEARIGVNTVIHGVGAMLVVWHAWALARVLDSVGVRMIAVAYLMYAAAQLVRGLRVVAGYSDGVAISSEPDFLVLTGAALLASLCSNIGYLGMALDRARLKDRSQRQALEQLREQQLALELAARERDAVRHERYRSSQVLAHEVRQPLHNAAVSLQAAVAALDGRRDAGDAVHALSQAQAVIRRVTASLDNTVALASLLTSDRRAPRQEVELDMLVALCVADLPPDARARVKVEHLADARSARLEPGLMRLALRNLLINATLYAPAGTPVTLRVLDCEDPLGLAFEVADLGPGLPPDVQHTLHDPQAAPGPSVAPGHGLGLQIVRRVAAMHDGRLDWRPNESHGSVFRMLLPQALPD
jgi:signal transduction histidine kinase